jgi:hypothetical protein
MVSCAAPVATKTRTSQDGDRLALRTVVLELDDSVRPEEAKLAVPWVSQTIVAQVLIWPHVPQQLSAVLISGAYGWYLPFQSVGRGRPESIESRIETKERRGLYGPNLRRVTGLSGPGSWLKFGPGHITTNSTLGLLPRNRSTVIRRPASRSLNTRTLVFRLKPCDSSQPFSLAEPLRVDRRLFRLSHAALAGSSSMA